MVFTIENGTTVKDRVTGFSGVVTGRCDYLTGCRQYLVQPAIDKDEKFVESRWFDEDRLLVQDAPTLALEVRRAGHDSSAPIK